jgi:5-methylcytosine-specific restriction endonuclease McrA
LSANFLEIFRIIGAVHSKKEKANQSESACGPCDPFHGLRTISFEHHFFFFFFFQNRGEKKWRRGIIQGSKISKQKRRGYPVIPKHLRVKRYVSGPLKLKVAAEQGWKCKECNVTFPGHFHIDHIFPLECGGDNNEENLQALCEKCHAQKTHEEWIEKFRTQRKVVEKQNKNPPPLPVQLMDWYEGEWNE